MKFATLSASCLALAMCSGLVFAQQAKTDMGKREFEANCASCHGMDGRGNGPLGNLLRVGPPDLTQLAKKNQGILPMNRLYEVIEGGTVAAHGTRDMPIWGREYRIDDAEHLKEARGNYDANALVRARILLLLEYLNRLQGR
ncbi:MAG: c-type cytochrome [Rhodoferax sp.]|nr:c-type cytochrome [Rhodoferax sp.]